MGRIIKLPDGTTETFLGLDDAVRKAKELCGDELVDFILEEACNLAFDERWNDLAPVQTLIDDVCDDYLKDRIL